MYLYKGSLKSVQELSELSGVKCHTIRDRLRRGYSVEQAVKVELVDESIDEFNVASWWKDWIGMSTTYLYKIYWNWGIENGYTPVSQIAFTRQLMKMYPNLKTVPTRTKEDKCMRIIRER